MGLKDKRCVPCEGGTPPLDEATTSKLLGQVSGWSTAARSGSAAHHASASSSSTSWPRWRSSTRWPRWRRKRGTIPTSAVHYNRVDVTLWTHAVSGPVRKRLHPRGQDRRYPGVMQGGVAISGATGLLGTALAASCARDGIPVSALVRDTVRGADLLPSAKLHAWDATRGSPPADGIRGRRRRRQPAGRAWSTKRWSEARKKQLARQPRRRHARAGRRPARSARDARGC